MLINPEFLKLLALPLAEYRPVVTDLSRGHGKALANAGTQHHLVMPAGALPTFAPLLEQARFSADLVFHTCTAADAGSALATALDLLSAYGEGILLVDGRPTFDHDLLEHVWAGIEFDGQTAIYFAHARQDSPLLTKPAVLGQVRLTCEMLQRQRLKYRFGAEARSFACTTDSVIAWDAAHGEYLARKKGKPRYNLVLGGRGKSFLATLFSPFDKRANQADDVTLSALNGKELKQVVTNRPMRQLLADLIKEQDATEPTIHPEVITAYRRVIADAIAQIKALRAGIPATNLPAGLCAELRPYQKDGFDFLAHLSRIGKGGILADDMGLGKTLQTLTWLLWLKQGNADGGPALVLCPASVMHNWRREAEKFTPQLKVAVLESGAKRSATLAKLGGFDLVITNYSLLRRDFPKLAATSFRALILDEAQFIKNPDSQVAKAVKQLPAGHRLALTGTPLENRLLDLWSIMDFASPGHLGTRQEFRETYDGAASPAMRKALSRQLQPLLLRRLKKDVAKDLPARIELRRDCSLTPAQRAFYQTELKRARNEVIQAVDEKGIQHSHIHVLAALTRLRQICCHPSLVQREALHCSPSPRLTGAEGSNGEGGGVRCSDMGSGKMNELFELLESLVNEGKKVLVFSQFTSMLDIIQTECRQRGFTTYLLTGDTKDRQAVVDAFNAAPPGCVFLLSLRAAGTGLNLTTASEVVLYDPWWNPAVEAQAIDRSHRIGQTCTVNAHRLISRDTIEERIWNIQQQKAGTINAVLGDGGFTRELTRTDLEYLFGGVGDEPSLAAEIETFNSQPSTPNQEVIPRHPSNSGRPQGRRNTRAPHIPPPATAAPPLWRQRVATKRPNPAVPEWRLRRGN